MALTPWASMLMDVVKWNTIMSCVLGAILNILLMRLIRWHTTKILQPYGLILLMTCVIDLCAITSTFICVPIGIRDSVNFSVIQAGRIGRWMCDWLGMDGVWPLTVHHYCLFSTPTGLAIQFVMRYFVMCKQYAAKLAHFALAFCVASTWQVAASALYNRASINSLASAMRDEPERTLRFLQTQRQLLSIPDLQFGMLIDMSSQYWKAVSNFVLLCSAIIYAVIGFCAYRIYQFSHQRLVDIKAAHAQNQINITLRIQASLPLCVIFVVNSINHLPMSSSDDALIYSIVLNVFAPWLPLLNPLITIIVVRAYRRAVVRLWQNLFFQPRKVKSSTKDSFFTVRRPSSGKTTA